VDEPSPERQASSRQELRRAADLIASLPAKCRQAFTLRRVEGLSQRDVARRMGISESTVEKHIGRALLTLMNAAGDGRMAKLAAHQAMQSPGAPSPTSPTPFNAGALS